MGEGGGKCSKASIFNTLIFYQTFRLQKHSTRVQLINISSCPEKKITYLCTCPLKLTVLNANHLPTLANVIDIFKFYFNPLGGVFIYDLASVSSLGYAYTTISTYQTKI